MVRPSAQSVEIFCRTRLRDFSSVGKEVETFEVRGSRISSRTETRDRKFVTYTDHSSLCWLMNVKDATGRLARWALFLQQYDFDVIHSPACQNGNAEPLSRRPYLTANLSALQQSVSSQTPITQLVCTLEMYLETYLKNEYGKGRM